MTTSAAGFFSVACMSTGMPRPLSTTVTLLSSCTETLISSQKPAMASSTELSTTSQTRWCRQSSPVEPMYMAGRLRTASMPPKTLMDVASYLCPAFPPADSFSAMDRASPQTARSYERKIVESLVIHGKAVARTARHLPCPLASAAEISGLDIFQSAFALARLEGLQLHPVPFRKFRGDAAKLLFSPAKRNRPHLTSSACSGASKKNWSEFGSDSAVQKESRTTKFYRKTGIFTRRLCGRD